MMRNRGRWDDCVQHWGDAAIAFVQDFFTDADRKDYASLPIMSQTSVRKTRTA